MLDEAGRAEFSTYAFFEDDCYEAVARFVDAGSAVMAAKRAIDVSARLPPAAAKIARVIVVDGGDCTVFEWRIGLGITFPEPMLYPPAPA